MTKARDSIDATVLALVASLAPDRLSPVTVDSDLIDDLGFDSPRKLELVAAIETQLGLQLPAPEQQIHTVHDVIAWISSNASRTGP